MNDTLYLPLKARWYDMFESDVKQDEYRDMTPYWMKRIYSCPANFDCGKSANCSLCSVAKRLKAKDFKHVRLSYGYTRRTITRRIISIEIGMGNPEWGAPTDRKVIIIKTKKI